MIDRQNEVKREREGKQANTQVQREMAEDVDQPMMTMTGQSDEKCHHKDSGISRSSLSPRQ